MRDLKILNVLVEIIMKCQLNYKALSMIWKYIKCYEITK